jgi:ribosomal protein L34E
MFSVDDRTLLQLFAMFRDMRKLIHARRTPVRVVSWERSYPSFTCHPCLTRLMLPNVRIPFAKPSLCCYHASISSQ